MLLESNIIHQIKTIPWFQKFTEIREEKNLITEEVCTPCEWYFAQIAIQERKHECQERSTEDTPNRE